jgi:hypothetical protein
LAWRQAPAGPGLRECWMQTVPCEARAVYEGVGGSFVFWQFKTALVEHNAI